ncbi:MAG: PHP domain-containing protein [Betaproteobacteria bacterium]|nr:PHP domain-containing protein [Betaproteobacteria bacterium]
MARYDLHCHSTCSDGLLPPADVVRRAAANGVDVIALTDHDQLAGLDEAREAALDAEITFIDGAELSVTWENETVHVVALAIDPANEALIEGLAAVRGSRDQRARRIGESLAAAGVPDAFEGARAHAMSDQLISRTHFARHLVDSGQVRDMQDAFRRFLTKGKPGYVAHAWPTLGEAVGWIHGAGGRAVIAHPGRYKLTTAGMRRLLAEFRDLGGDAIEVVSPSHTAAQSADFVASARVFGFKASSGSDWHGPGESRWELGQLPPMPDTVDPVWADW